MNLRNPKFFCCSVGFLSAVLFFSLRTADSTVTAQSEAPAIDLFLKSTSPDESVAQAALAKIDARCRNVGNIDLILPAGGNFDLVASTEKGEVRNDYGGSVRMDTEGRTQTMRSSTGGGPSIQVTTARGTVTVRTIGRESAIL